MIHNKLKEFRTNAGLTQQEVAFMIGMKSDGYCRIEKGNRKLSTNRLNQLAKALNVSVIDLLSGEDQYTKDLKDTIFQLNRTIKEQDLLIRDLQNKLISILIK